MRLHLDHLILRTGDPEATLATLEERGFPVLSRVKCFGGLESGIVHAAPIDLEVLQIGDDPPTQPQGYGLGFVADVELTAAIRALRELGLATAPAPRVSVGRGGDRRTWRAAQLHGLLPDPFPAPVRTGAPGLADALLGGLAGVMARIPAVARAATRRAGSSMVVLTEYEFDPEALRAAAGPGPRTVAVHVGTHGRAERWARLPLEGPVRLVFDDSTSGVARIELEGIDEPFRCGAVEFTPAVNVATA
jgi:hypothetical protein